MTYFLTLFVIQTTEGRKNLGNTMVGVNVDVLEILRFALNDKYCKTLCLNLFLKRIHNPSRTTILRKGT